MSKSVLVIDTTESCRSCYLREFTLDSQYCCNTAAQSVRMTVSDVRFTSIARNVSWDVQAIRAR